MSTNKISFYLILSSNLCKFFEMFKSLRITKKKSLLKTIKFSFDNNNDKNNYIIIVIRTYL